MAGIVAAALALSVLWAASRATPSVPFAPLALAERLVRLAPGDLATLSIEQLGHAAIPLLTAGTVAALLGVGAAVPALVGNGSPTRYRFTAAAFFVVLLAAALTYRLPGSSWLGLLAGSMAGAVLYCVTLEWLAELELRRDRPADPSRRAALGWLVLAAGGLLTSGTLLGRLAARRGSAVTLAAADQTARIPARPPFPVVADLAPEVTPPRDHYVIDIAIVDPVVVAEDWRLQLDGMVRRPLQLGADELQRRFSVVEEHSVLTCISNPVGGSLVGSSKWTGVRLRDVLAAADPHGAATRVVFESADGYSVSVPLSTAIESPGLLAFGQGGQPLRPEHGAPCRVRLPALYGMLNAKWLDRIHVTDGRQPGYWARRGWSETGVVRTASRIDTRADVLAGVPTWVAGVAWAGVRGVKRVEVSTDGGRTWADATLHPPVSPYAWTQWALRWRPPGPGDHTIFCRATDGEGRVQDAAPRPPHPSGSTGYHQVRLRAD